MAQAAEVAAAQEGLRHAAGLGEQGQGALQEALAGKLNLWIAKPGALSRGRGIRVFNDEDEILRHSGFTVHSVRAPQHLVS